MTIGTNSMASLPVTMRQIVSEDFPRRVAAMLGRSDLTWHAGMPVPFGWHFPLLGAETFRSALRSDGFPGLGVPMPDLPGKRLVAVGRTLEQWRALHIGQEIVRVSQIASVTSKSTAQGSINFVTVEHVIHNHQDAALILKEEQTFVLLDTPFAAAPPSPPDSNQTRAIGKTITPDETMLFQFSALSFNSHKIHLDRDYAGTVEGYPDLVVNGGLTTLLMTEFAQTMVTGTIKRLAVRNTAPLFCNRLIQLVHTVRDGCHAILALNDAGRVAAEMEFKIDDL
jgi:3-methylfumaryl-CoA hydratase